MTKLLALVGTLARFAVFISKREALRDRTHAKHSNAHGEASDCLCEPCQWVRGIEADADAALEKWR